MITRWSQTLIPTARQVPGDAVVPSHQLMLRAGLIRKLQAGVYDYLPLGLRSLQKVMAIIRQEMNAAGAVEVLLPTLQPIELWEKTGRRTAYGENLLVVTDRHGRQQALGPTHEEVITELVGGYIESYKQLPLTLYQIQTKFRDEFRPRFGVLRSREFQMKDAYSFHADLASLDETYQKQYEAYRKIFTRCGVPFEIVEAESGPIGGSASHEFMVPSPTGEDTILKSDKGNYAANVEKCEIGPRPSDLTLSPTGDLEKIDTPGCSAISDVIAYFKKSLKTKLKEQNMLKTLVYVATRISDHANPRNADDRWYILAVVRSDHDVNEAKLLHVASKLLDAPAQVALAPQDLAGEDGFTMGYVGPHTAAGRDDTHVVIDCDAAQGGFWVTGANEKDAHVKHFNWQRDLIEHVDQSKVHVADIRNAMTGDPSPKDDGGLLTQTKGIEVGHVFKLGTKYTQALGADVLDANNQRVPMLMGCYGIGVNRILASAIENPIGHDEHGIIWPTAIAPYHVIITPIAFTGQMQQTAQQIGDQLSAQGIEVLLDDRDERPGVKFKDADLIGIPLRITIGEKSLKNSQVEVKMRHASDIQMIDVDQVVAYIKEKLHLCP